jgi:NADH:ubiquinone oxidoreductase subunit H
MAYAVITLTNGIEIKKAPLGFSWTTFFFGGWPAIFRQDWIVGILSLLINLATSGIAGIIFAFFYNKMYLKSLLEKGYKIHSMPPNISEEMVRDYVGYITMPGTTEQA